MKIELRAICDDGQKRKFGYSRIDTLAQAIEGLAADTLDLTVRIDSTDDLGALGKLLESMHGVLLAGMLRRKEQACSNAS